MMMSNTIEEDKKRDYTIRIIPVDT